MILDALPRLSKLRVVHRTTVSFLAALAAALVGTGHAQADGWLPHPADATWEYSWTDSVYNTTPTSGSHTLTATQTLTAGVTSAASAAWVVTVPSH